MAVATMTKSEVILEDLLAANKKYANDELTGDLIAAGAKESVRKSLENGQAPVACVVCCSDSRVPPEVIFQKGLGQLFVVRTAGNRADDDSVLGSVQYAICHLNVPLLMVLGHSSCGAMKAAIGAAKGSLPGEDEAALRKYLENCGPLAKITLDRVGEEDAMASLPSDNAMNVVELLKKDAAIAAKNPMIVSAVYSLTTGLVNVVEK